MSQPLSIQQTKEWVEQIVVGLNLCPFAQYPLQAETIRYLAVANTNQLRTIVADELQYLSAGDSDEVETTLLVIESGYEDFLAYLDLIDQCQAILVQGDYEGEIQIASFHPQYQFADLNADDVRNYTNRSPYPMIHLIRESSISRAVDTYPNIDHIPVRNQELLLKLGKGYFEK